MNKIIYYICSCMIATLISCSNRKDSTILISPDKFIKSETLEGQTISFDTIPGIVGSVIPVDSLYFCYLFRSDNYLMVTDRDFNILGYTAHRGGGPGEVSQISFLYGKILKDADFCVLDPNKRMVYGCYLDNWNQLVPKLDLSLDSNIPTPLYLQEMNDGKYLMAYMDYEYGLYTYDPCNNSISYWPIGLDLPEEKKYDISCGRGMSYNKANDIAAEFYSSLPVLILHNGEGEVVRIIQYADMPLLNSLTDDSPIMIEDVWLTDNCIFTLLGDGCIPADTDGGKPILVTDYKGNPIVRLNIKQASSFSIDEEYHRLITVNSDEDENIAVYNLPTWLVL